MRDVGSGDDDCSDNSNGNSIGDADSGDGDSGDNDSNSDSGGGNSDSGGKNKHSLRMGWRNFFSSCDVVSGFGSGGK